MKYWFTLVFVASFFLLNAQLKPVKWSQETIKADDGSYELLFTASMDNNWVIYSQHTAKGGPVPTSFKFSDQSCKTGTVEERSRALKSYSDLFMLEVIKFKKESIFVQKFKADCVKNIKATIEYMTCDGGRCLPPTEVVFNVTLE